MRATVTQEDPPPAPFAPITITIHLDTLEEARGVNYFFSLDETIPAALHERGYTKELDAFFALRRHFLDQLREAIYK